MQVSCGVTEVGASTAPATAGRLPAAARSKIKIVYVWRYLSSLLFQAVHIYNLFWYMGAVCFGIRKRFVSVYVYTANTHEIHGKPSKLVLNYY